MRGNGLYPAMLTAMRDHVQEFGCKGIVSEAHGRVGLRSTASWEKFAEREPRVVAKKKRDTTLKDYFFAGLES